MVTRYKPFRVEGKVTKLLPVTKVICEEKTWLCPRTLKTVTKAVSETGIIQIAIAGGVSANSGLRSALTASAEKNGWKVNIPISYLATRPTLPRWWKTTWTTCKMETCLYGKCLICWRNIILLRRLWRWWSKTLTIKTSFSKIDLTPEYSGKVLLAAYEYRKTFIE